MTLPIRAKKSLGQHFLTDKNIARNITGSLVNPNKLPVIEIGPGTGALTGFLIESQCELTLVEIDTEAAGVLRETFGTSCPPIVNGDFLKAETMRLLPLPACIIGNFPYNISSQIFFRILENRDQIPEVVCMIQREVAQRIAAPPGSKTYGILSVLLQAWYHIEYLFTVHENVFNPPPKVKSAVIRLTRNQTTGLNCNEILFFKVVKGAFNQRRKTLRNALKSSGFNITCVESEMLDKRAEQLSVEQFIELTRRISEAAV
ncbi:MAG TPA: 16S rRNA (adenine(1518)-N(6)/adenine(1519)-N(6))-dimethyltransferase RsmA [Bacteroidales bacterium]|nr:16S rRNA (adenine(1518)-N(6)/adenine(1519)-N(6))-dimethyltransferase RsmA [Bacteroidales bacterium]